MLDLGVWDADVEVLAGPAPSRTSGSMTSRAACGGVWLVSDFETASGFAGHGIQTWARAETSRALRPIE
jgi:hypothetical protein